jgi:hypothetical protein
MMELKGLGAWLTQSGNIVLYADFAKESAQSIKRLAKSVRDYLYDEMARLELTKRKEMDGNDFEMGEVNGFGSRIEVNIPHDTILSVNNNDLDLSSKENRKELNELEKEVDNTSGSKEKSSENESDCSDGTDGSLENYIDSMILNSPSTLPFETVEMKKKPHAPSPIFANDDGFDFEGIWMDDPYDGVFIPHLTLMNSDARTDKVLREHILESVTTKSRKNEKRDKRGRTGKGSKGAKGGKKEAKSSKNVSRGVGKGGGNDDSADSQDGDSQLLSSNFGWNYKLMRDTRREFAKFVFGRQEVTFVELQGGFRCIQRIDITGGREKNNTNGAK